MRIRLSYLTALLIAAAVGLWLLSGQIDLGGPPPSGGQAPANPASAEERDELPRVRVREVTATQRVRDVVIQGETRPSRQVVLRAETTGSVVALPVREGQPVDEGQVLAELSAEDREARLEEARALLAQRQLEYEQAARLAQRDFASRTRVAQARAELDAARARVAAAEAELDRTRIRAPFAGVLDQLTVEMGDYVAPGGEVATLLDLDPLVIAGEVTEREVGNLAVGAAAWARLIDGRRLEGEITYIAARAAPGTRTYPVEVTVANPDGVTIAGLSAEIHLPTRAMRAHLVPPSILTLNDAGEIGVKTVDADGMVRFRPVEILGDEPAGVWVDGLPQTARVITVGQEYVAAGQPVQPVPEQNIEG